MIIQKENRKENTALNETERACLTMEGWRYFNSHQKLLLTRNSKAVTRNLLISTKVKFSVLIQFKGIVSSHNNEFRQEEKQIYAAHIILRCGKLNLDFQNKPKAKSELVSRLNKTEKSCQWYSMPIGI